MGKGLFAGVLLLLPALFSDSSRAERDKLIRRIQQAEKARRWQDAIALSEEVIERFKGASWPDPQMVRADIGRYCLFDLQLDAAVRQFNEVLAGPSRDKGISGDLPKAMAAYGMARANAERGHFRQALEWLDAWVRKYPSRCGTCSEGRVIEAHVLRHVWKSAMLPADQARKRLARIIGGEFRPLKARLIRATGRTQKKEAAMEASLIWAEMLLRLGEKERAQAAFRNCTGGHSDTRNIAVAHLAQIKEERSRQEAPK